MRRRATSWSQQQQQREPGSQPLLTLALPQQSASVSSFSSFSASSSWSSNQHRHYWFPKPFSFSRNWFGPQPLRPSIATTGTSWSTTHVDSQQQQQKLKHQPQNRLLGRSIGLRNHSHHRYPKNNMMPSSSHSSFHAPPPPVPASSQPVPHGPYPPHGFHPPTVPSTVASAVLRGPVVPPHSSSWETNYYLTPQAVASLPPPGLGGPTQPVFSPARRKTTMTRGSRNERSGGGASWSHHSNNQHDGHDYDAATQPLYLAFISSTSQTIRQVKSPPALYRPLTSGGSTATTTTTTTTSTNTAANPPLTVHTLPANNHLAGSNNNHYPLYPYNNNIMNNNDYLSSSGHSSSHSGTGWNEPISATAAPPPQPSSAAAQARPQQQQWSTTASSSQQPPQQVYTASVGTERILLCLDLTQHVQQQQRRQIQQQQSSSQSALPLEARPRPLLRLEYPSSQQQQPTSPSHALPNTIPISSQQQQQPRSKRRMFDTASHPYQSSTHATATSPLSPPSPSSSTVSTPAAAMAAASQESLEERLRRERQRLSGGSLTQFSWTWTTTGAETNGAPSSLDAAHASGPCLRLLIPARGSLFVQDGISEPPHAGYYSSTGASPLATAAPTALPARCLHDKTTSGAAVDPQLSPDGSMVAWTCDGEIYVKSATASCNEPAIRVSYGSVHTEDISISHGVADFVAQEEMDRYRGFWWHPDSNGILLTRVDESKVPLFRIMHHHHPPEVQVTTGSATTSASYEDHRYPFAGKENPTVKLGFVQIDRESVLAHTSNVCHSYDDAQSTSSFAPLENHHAGHGAGEDPNHHDDDDNDHHHNPRHRHPHDHHDEEDDDDDHHMISSPAAEVAADNWNNSTWFDPPREASEYLARVHWLPDGSALAQWQNRAQSVSVLYRMDLVRRKGRTLLIERSDVWINLHHMFHVLPRAIHPSECSGLDTTNTPPLPNPLPNGSFSFLFASERTGFSHLYLYTFAPEINSEQAVLIKAISGGEWMVEHILGVDFEKDVVYFTGTYDSVLERHLYALPIRHHPHFRVAEGEHTMIAEDSPSTSSSSAASPNGMRRGLSKVMSALSGKGNRYGRSSSSSSQECDIRPIRLTQDAGMHSIVMDDDCQYFVDTGSDLNRPPSVHIYQLPDLYQFSCMESRRMLLVPVLSLYEAMYDDKSLSGARSVPTNGKSLAGGGVGPSDGNGVSFVANLPPPEMVSFPTSDGAETLYAALYRPDPAVYGPGPYPLICAVYGGPHVQRVNRSWSQCADMRAQRLRSLGFCVIKCDNRGSSRRGLKFESAISRRLGRIEVLDQVAAVRQLTIRGIADPNRVGIYGWSYGGYLAAMCLCRAPDVFHVAVAGAPVTSWDGYDTHYTERYMGTPTENPSGYRESAVFDHVPNMRGKLMIVHGLIDENVHFRHTARLVNKLTASGKDYDLLIFPDERHSPRRFRDRVYMEERVSEYFVRHLAAAMPPLDLVDTISHGGMQQLRAMAGHL